MYGGRERRLPRMDQDLVVVRDIFAKAESSRVQSVYVTHLLYKNWGELNIMGW